MTLEKKVIIKTNDLPIRHEGEVHDGKVRSVYWLTPEDSKRISSMYMVGDTDVGAMITSDRISAFECIWESESGLKGIPGKGAALNAISHHWFKEFEKEGLAGHHIIETPHPLVWLVKRAKPILVEAVARQYITGGMWRDYKEKGIRSFGGVTFPDGIKEGQKLEQLLITPSTKGIIKGIEGIPEHDDVNITREQIIENYKAFGFKSVEDVRLYERLLAQGFNVIGKSLEALGKIFVDTKFEFGYIGQSEGNLRMIYMDEVGTPDSSRYWDASDYLEGTFTEESKEYFRKELLKAVPDRDVLLNKKRMPERIELAKNFRVPDRVFMETSRIYTTLAERITGSPVREIKDARAEIIDALTPYGIIER